MLTNTLLLYMTQEAIAKARAKLTARKTDAAAKDGAPAAPAAQPVWQAANRNSPKLRMPLRH